MPLPGGCGVARHRPFFCLDSWSMWRIENPELRRATLDFTSSEQGYREVTQLFSNGIELINAVELVDWDSEDTQFLICEACGITNCEPGGWVSVRRSGLLVLILPSVDHVWPERDEDKKEYAPPAYLRRRGVAYFDRTTYEGLRSQHSAFPPFDRFQHLTMREATLLFHWDAPAQVLGAPPIVQLRHDLITGSSEGDAVGYVEHLENLITDQYKDNSEALLRPLTSGENPISIFLTTTEFIDWKPLMFDGLSYRLVVDSKYVIDSHSRSNNSRS